MKTKKLSVVLMTLASALVFCSLLVVSSMSSLSKSGPNANEFGSMGMWVSIGLVLVLYIIPLVIYMLGVNAMKIIMAILCGIGLLIILAIILSTLVVGSLSEGNSSDILGVIVLCIVALIINIIWFFVAFSSSPSITYEA